MKIYGHTHVTVLPTSPTPGSTVFLSADGVNGDLLYWSGVAWQSLAFTVYSNYRPDVEFELTLPTSTPAIEHTWQQGIPSPTNASATLTSGTKIKVLGKLGVPNPYPRAFFQFVAYSEELLYNNPQISTLFGTQAMGHSNTNQFGLPQSNALAVNFVDVNLIKPPGDSWANPAAVITTLNIPTATSIPAGAWSLCMNLSVVDIPNVTSIGAQAFANTSSTQLTTISAPSVVTIGDQAFVVMNPNGAGNSTAVAPLAPLSLPNCTTLGYGVFQSSGLISIGLPVLTSIPPATFSGCLGLTIVLASGATSVGDNAFANCYAIVELDLSSVTTWGVDVFSNIGGQTILLIVADAAQASVPAIVELMANNTVTLQYL